MAILTPSRRPCRARSRPCRGRRCQPRRCCSRWRPRVASRFFADPRQVLRNAARPLQELGLTAVAATELEFYLLDAGTRRDGRPRRRLGAYLGHGARRTDRSTVAWRTSKMSTRFSPSCTRSARRRTFPRARRSRNSHPDSSRSICVTSPARSSPAITPCCSKRAVKAVAQAPWPGRELHGEAVRATAQAAACTCTSASRIKPVRNVFADRAPDQSILRHLRHAIGGLAATMAESMAIFAPTANSYRRYRPGLFVPLAPNWGVNHRGVALRIPLSGPRRHADRTSARRRGRQSVSGDGRNPRGHSPRNHESLRPGPDGRAGRGHRRKSCAAAALGSGARRIRQRDCAAAVPRQALSRCCSPRVVAKNAIASTPRSRIATTSGICARSDRRSSGRQAAIARRDCAARAAPVQAV